MVDSRFLRFLLVGILNTLFGYGLYSVFLFIGLHYSLAVLLSTILGVLFNFKTIGKLVFRNSDNSKILRFIFVYVITYGVNVGFLRIFKALHMNMYLAGAVMLFPIAVLSFLLQRHLVFK